MNQDTNEIRNFETLIAKNNINSYSKRWSPTFVETFTNTLMQDGLAEMNKAEIKNIAYSLQYLQFLQLELEELKLHNIVEKHLWKTYIITAMAIIEVIFNHVVKKNNKQEKDEWSNVELSTNSITHNGEEQKCTVIIQTKLDDPIDKEMNFAALIDIVEKNRLIPFRSKAYRDLQVLRKVRNKIHLKANEMADSDYYAIEKKYYLFARRYLYFILTNENICSSHSTTFNFLQLSDNDSEELSNYLVDTEET